MGKSILSFLLLILLSISAIYAQQELKYGIKFGLTRSDLNFTMGNSYSSYDFSDTYDGNSVNPTIGLFIDYALTDNLILETDLSYIIKGIRKTEDIYYTTVENPDGEGKSKYTYEFAAHYLELGVHIKPVVKIGVLPCYAILGTSLNYNITATGLVKKDISDFLLSYKIGFGINIEQITNLPLFTEVKYSGDFTDYYSSEYMKLKNRVLSLTMGLYL